MQRLSVAKFGGGLLDRDGKNIPVIMERIRELRDTDGLGPLVVFSAPTGYTDELIRVGESHAQSRPVSANALFGNYENMARRFVKDECMKPFLSELYDFRKETHEALALVDKRFHGSIKARVLTSGGELPTSVLMEYVMKSSGLDSCHISKKQWPIITDDNFENAAPLYEVSRNKVNYLTEPLERRKIVSVGGFLGMTTDDLETMLGRGGSDLTAVFISCLLKDRYFVETLLFKDVSVQSADPLAVDAQKTEHVTSLTYNEAHKASMMGMKIVQDAAIQTAKQFQQPLRVVPIHCPEECTEIQSKSVTRDIVKCVTGKSGCAILSMRDEKSRSLEDSLRIWVGQNDFFELGTETLETGERIRDFLFLDSAFLRKSEERLKGFDESLTVEYGVGVVTLIGDRMKDSPGVASMAIGAIPNINIKRAVFAPHTSQIILVVEEKNVNPTVAAIHSEREKMNRPH